MLGLIQLVSNDRLALDRSMNAINGIQLGGSLGETYFMQEITP